MLLPNLGSRSDCWTKHRFDKFGRHWGCQGVLPGVCGEQLSGTFGQALSLPAAFGLHNRDAATPTSWRIPGPLPTYDGNCVLGCKTEVGATGAESREEKTIPVQIKHQHTRWLGPGGDEATRNRHLIGVSSFQRRRSRHFDRRVVVRLARIWANLNLSGAARRDEALSGTRGPRLRLSMILELSSESGDIGHV